MAAAFTLVLLVDDGVSAEQRARLDAALATTGARVLDPEATRALVGALQVEACADVECLARLSVLAEADRAAFVRAEGDALAVIVADAVPRNARAVLRAGDDDGAWTSALQAALALTFDDTPINASESVAPDPAQHDALAPTPATPVPTASEQGDARAATAVGAGLLGVGALTLTGASIAGALALGSMRASDDAKFQDDAVARARDANAQLWITGVLAGVTVATGVTGGILLAVGALE